MKIANPEEITGDDHLICDVSFRFDDLHNGKNFITGGVRSSYVTEATYRTASDQLTYIQVFRKKNGAYLNHRDSIRVASNELVQYEVVF